MAANAQTIKDEERALRRCSVGFLRDEYKRSHRVSDTRELTKTDLVFALLRGKFGAAAVAAAYAPFKAQEVAYRDHRGEWRRRTFRRQAAFASFTDKLNDDAREWYAREAQ